MFVLLDGKMGEFFPDELHLQNLLQIRAARAIPVSALDIPSH
jgi:hypothetical protein